jgi:hypothetical protein
MYANCTIPLKNQEIRPSKTLVDGGASNSSYVKQSFVQKHPELMAKVIHGVAKVELGDGKTVVEVHGFVAIPVRFDECGDSYEAELFCGILPHLTCDLVVGLPDIVCQLSQMHHKMIEERRQRACEPGPEEVPISFLDAFHCIEGGMLSAFTTQNDPFGYLFDSDIDDCPSLASSEDSDEDIDTDDDDDVGQEENSPALHVKSQPNVASSEPETFPILPPARPLVSRIFNFDGRSLSEAIEAPPTVPLAISRDLEELYGEVTREPFGGNASTRLYRWSDRQDTYVETGLSVELVQGRVPLHFAHAVDGANRLTHQAKVEFNGMKEHPRDQALRDVVRRTALASYAKDRIHASHQESFALRLGNLHVTSPLDQPTHQLTGTKRPSEDEEEIVLNPPRRPFRLKVPVQVFDRIPTEPLPRPEAPLFHPIVIDDDSEEEIVLGRRFVDPPSWRGPRPGTYYPTLDTLASRVSPTMRRVSRPLLPAPLVLPASISSLNVVAPLHQLLVLPDPEPVVHTLSSLTSRTTLTVRNESESSSENSVVDTDPVAYDEMEYTHPWLNEADSDQDEFDDPEEPDPEPESPGSVFPTSPN